MPLLRAGRLFAGALFAGALLTGSQEAAPPPEIHVPYTGFSSGVQRSLFLLNGKFFGSVDAEVAANGRIVGRYTLLPDLPAEVGEEAPGLSLAEISLGAGASGLVIGEPHGAGMSGYSGLVAGVGGVSGGVESLLIATVGDRVVAGGIVTAKVEMIDTLTVTIEAQQRQIRQLVALGLI